MSSDPRKEWKEGNDGGVMLVPGYHFSATEDYFHSVSRINTLMPFQRGESGVTEVGETSHHKYKQVCPPFLNL